jgi:hypothetical protein
MTRREGDLVMSNDEQSREARNIQSWESTRTLFQEMLTTLHGARLKPIVQLIDFVIGRELYRYCCASQSHGRLVISSTGNVQSQPYLMISAKPEGEFLFQFYALGNSGPALSTERHYSLSTAIAFLDSTNTPYFERLSDG